MNDSPDFAGTPPGIPDAIKAAPSIVHARFTVGDVVRHRLLDFRGVAFVPEKSNF